MRAASGRGKDMAVRPILKLGHPTLRQVAAPVPAFDTPELHALVADMQDTMRAADGAGLAAIQLGVLQRVVIFGLDYSPRYPTAEPVPFTFASLRAKSFTRVRRTSCMGLLQAGSRVRISACPTPPWDTVPRTGRNERKHLRP